MHFAKSGKWRWSFCSEAAWRDLAPFPEKITEDSELVKANGVRTVFRRGAYYIKVELPKPMFSMGFWTGLLHSKTKREFLAASALKAAGIPVVEPVGYGFGPGSSALVTRALDGAETAGDYYYRNFVKEAKSPDRFLKGWSAFVRRILDSGFLHPDFHNGNILYAPETERFALVDVYGVSRPAGGPRGKKLEAMRRIVFEMRRPLSVESLAALAADCGIPKAGDFVERGLKAEAKTLLKNWPKRKAQILAGYGKFIKKVDFEGRQLWLPLDIAKEPAASAGELNRGAFEALKGDAEELKKTLLSAFLCQFAGVPHRRIFAYDPSEGALYLEKLEPGRPPEAWELESFNRYARLYGMEAKAEALGRDSKGRLTMTSFDFGLP